MKWLQLCIVVFSALVIFVGGRIKGGHKGVKRHNSTNACTTPNGEAATCQPWYNCTVLLIALVNEEPSAKKFAEASKCGNTPLVCCGSSGNFIPKIVSPNSRKKLNQKTPANDTKEAKIEFAIRNLLPDRSYCGYQHTDDYFYNKNETSLDEFPWLVHIPLRNVSSSSIFSRVKGLRCTGFIISKRYVITERWCGSDKEIIDKVMIGQYHRDKSTTCIDDPLFPECTDPLLEVNVTEILRPEVDSEYISNIKLLRLEKTLTFTDYVRPICLPLDESRRVKINDTVVTSGWGALDFDDSQGKIKKRIKHTVETIELEGDGIIEICVNPQDKNSTVCAGDNGGPLMYSYRNQWFAEGVISLDDAGITCNDPDLLSCAARLSPINIEWILLNMKP